MADLLIDILFILIIYGLNIWVNDRDNQMIGIGFKNDQNISTKDSLQTHQHRFVFVSIKQQLFKIKWKLKMLKE